MIKKSIAATAAILLFCSIAWALDDTPANRSAQADRYLTAMPVKEMLDDMVAQMLKSFPAEHRERFLEVFKHLDMPAVEKAMKKAMIKHFTADELKALADFYGSPVGKSAMKKMGPYMADAMPAIQAEMAKAQAKVSGPAQGAAIPGEPKEGEPEPQQ